ncbi:Nucleoside-triphosphatase THEP1 [subsurface metagenome]
MHKLVKERDTGLPCCVLFVVAVVCGPKDFTVMSSNSAKILLTGLPGCGKTTAIMNIIDTLNCEKVAGFYTREIRQNNIRKGFCWKRLDGADGTLAHINIKGPMRVGKYGVDVAGFEESVVPILDVERVDVELFIIDEIGKMECLSGKFVAAVRRLFASEKSVLATVAQKGAGLISEVKKYPNTKVFNLTRSDCDKTVTEILKILSFLREP